MPYKIPRCQVIPLPDDQVSFQVEGQERLRWHFGSKYPRPFFYPLLGPSGSSLTRMGHPGAANHDHHRSIWFAHNKVTGIDFWSDRTNAQIRQQHWLRYQDGQQQAAMAVMLGWYDGHDPQPLLEQELVAVMLPGRDGETFLELQATFRPKAETLELGQTNFGFLAVRVAKNISAHFGGGELTNSSGAQGEPQIFGKPSQWMDYSGPVPGEDNSDEPRIEGITYFDHPANPGFPNRWHVREDGWMGASLCHEAPLQIERAKPLVVRYLLHAHAGDIDVSKADSVATGFARRPGFAVRRVSIKHQQYEIERLKG